VEAARRYIAASQGRLGVFGASPVRDALIELADYVVTRSR